jgi:hypothetical protein
MTTLGVLVAIIVFVGCVLGIVELALFVLEWWRN